MRVVAVDWAGAIKGATKKIWVAKVANGQLECLIDGRSREEVVSYVIGLAERNPELVVGFDFAFSAPQWFLEKKGLRSAVELWELAANAAEEWIEACEPPFWGRGTRKRPE